MVPRLLVKLIYILGHQAPGEFCFLLDKIYKMWKAFVLILVIETLASGYLFPKGAALKRKSYRS